MAFLASWAHCWLTFSRQNTPRSCCSKTAWPRAEKARGVCARTHEAKFKEDRSGLTKNQTPIISEIADRDPRSVPLRVAALPSGCPSVPIAGGRLRQGRARTARRGRPSPVSRAVQGRTPSDREGRAAPGRPPAPAALPAPAAAAPCAPPSSARSPIRTPLLTAAERGSRTAALPYREAAAVANGVPGNGGRGGPRWAPPGSAQCGAQAELHAVPRSVEHRQIRRAARGRQGALRGGRGPRHAGIHTHVSQPAMDGLWWLPLKHTVSRALSAPAGPPKPALGQCPSQGPGFSSMFGSSALPEPSSGLPVPPPLGCPS